MTPTGKARVEGLGMGGGVMAIVWVLLEKLLNPVPMVSQEDFKELDRKVDKIQLAVGSSERLLGRLLSETDKQEAKTDRIIQEGLPIRVVNKKVIVR